MLKIYLDLDLMLSLLLRDEMLSLTGEETVKKTVAYSASALYIFSMYHMHYDVICNPQNGESNPPDFFNSSSCDTHL